MFDGSGWGQLGTVLGDLLMNQISEGVGFLYANTYGKGVGLYNSNGIEDALLTAAILNSGNYVGRNYGANTPDAQYNPFLGMIIVLKMQVLNMIQLLVKKAYPINSKDKLIWIG